MLKSHLSKTPACFTPQLKHTSLRGSKAKPYFLSSLAPVVWANLGFDWQLSQQPDWTTLTLVKVCFNGTKQVSCESVLRLDDFQMGVPNKLSTGYRQNNYLDGRNAGGSQRPVRPYRPVPDSRGNHKHWKETGPLSFTIKAESLIPSIQICQ